MLLFLNQTYMEKNQLLDRFKEEKISYNELEGSLRNFNSEEQEKILKEVEAKQADFWSETVDYYYNIHPNVPIVAEDHKEFLGIVAENLPEKAVVADLACGCGVLTRKLLSLYPEKVKKIINIDYVSGMLENTSKEATNTSVDIEIIEADLQKQLPLESDLLDGAFSNWGIVYFRKPVLVSSLKEIKRALRPGKRIVFSALFNSGKEMASVVDLLDEETLKTKGDLIKKGLDFERRLKLLFPRYIKEELIEITEKAGLKYIENIETFYGRSVTIVAEA